MMWYHEALLQYSAADYTGLTWMNWKNILIKKRIFLILHISRAGFLVTMMLLQLHVRNGGIGSAPSSTITNINLT